MQYVDIIKAGEHVVILGVIGGTLSGNKISNYLINECDATYLNYPINMYVVPNTTVGKLENDPNIILPTLTKESSISGSPRKRPLPKRKNLPSQERVIPINEIIEPVLLKKALPKRKLSISPKRIASTKSTINKIKDDIMKMDSLEDIVKYYETSPNKTEIKNILDDLGFFGELIEKYKLTYIHNFDELLELNEELNKTQTRTRIHYKNVVNEYKVGDRVYFKDINYKILKASNTEINMQEVDMFGNILSKEIKHGMLTHNKYTGKHRKWFWYDKDMSEHLFGERGITPGILLYNYGPKINSLDSLFLKYKTLPYNTDILASDELKEIGMLVSVQNSENSPYDSYVYLITDIFDDGSLELEYVDELNKEIMVEGAKMIIAKRRYNVKDVYRLWDATVLGNTRINFGSWYSGFDPPR
jgi:hypothetical protein